MRQIAVWITEQALWLLLAVGTMYNYLQFADKQNELRISGKCSAVLSVLHTVVGLLCVKVFAFLEGTPGGMSLYGGILCMPVIYYAAARLSKRKVSAVFDTCTFCIVFTLMCARINCLMSGCCLGKVIPGTELRWPTRQLELVFYLILLFFLSGQRKKGALTGKYYPVFMVSYGQFRFIAEWFRESEHVYGIFHISHIWSLVSIAVGIAVLFIPDKKLFRFLIKKQKSSEDSPEQEESQ